jgi:hypothetical protein
MRQVCTAVIVRATKTADGTLYVACPGSITQSANNDNIGSQERKKKAAGSCSAGQAFVQGRPAKAESSISRSGWPHARKSFRPTRRRRQPTAENKHSEDLEHACIGDTLSYSSHRTNLRLLQLEAVVITRCGPPSPSPLTL